MNSKQLNILLGIVVVALLGALIYTTFSKNNASETNTVNNIPVLEQTSDSPQSEDVQSTPSTDSWKDSVYSQFDNLTDWKVENLSDWRLIDMSHSKLDKYGTGKILALTKSFDNYGGPEGEGQAKEAALETLKASVTQTLKSNKWQLVSSPTEGGFYQDYLYEKDGHPLVLQIGDRVAVKGGVYLTIEFLY